MLDKSAIGTAIRESSLLFPVIEGVHVLALALSVAIPVHARAQATADSYRTWGVYGGGPDMLLTDGDIVFVPTSNVKLYSQQAINAAIGTATSYAIYRLATY